MPQPMLTSFVLKVSASWRGLERLMRARRMVCGRRATKPHRSAPCQAKEDHHKGAREGKNKKNKKTQHKGTLICSRRYVDPDSQHIVTDWWSYDWIHVNFLEALPLWETSVGNFSNQQDSRTSPLRKPAPFNCSSGEKYFNTYAYLVFISKNFL